MKTAKFLVMAVLLLTLCVGLAQAKPNFSGDWKLNAPKSDFGAMPPPEKWDYSIVHNDPALKVAMTMAAEFGEFKTDQTLTTDGKECVNTSDRGTIKSVLTWDGDTLVTDSTMSFDGNDMKIVDHWTLSEDGKTLTMKRHFSGGMGEGDQTLVLDKQ